MLVTIQEVGKITTKTQRLEYPYSQQSINAQYKHTCEKPSKGKKIFTWGYNKKL